MKMKKLLSILLTAAILGTTATAYADEEVQTEAVEAADDDVMTPFGKYPEPITVTTAKVAVANPHFPEGKSSKDNVTLDWLSIYQKAELKKLFNNQVSIMAPNNMQIKEVLLDNLNGLRFHQYYQDNLSYTDVLSGEVNRDYEELYKEALLNKDKEIFVRADAESFIYLKIIYGLKTLKPVGYFAAWVDSSVLQTILPDGSELRNAAYVVVDTYEESENQIVFYAGSIEDPEKMVGQYYDGTLPNIWKSGRIANELSGFDLIVEKEPHIVLTDIRMPGMDGLSIIEKAKHLYPKMQFILFSGYTDFAYARKAIVLGVLDYIVKPITADKVEDALQKALDHIDDADNLLLQKELQESLLQGETVTEAEWESAQAPMAVSDIRECLILSCDLPKENVKIREYLRGKKELKKYGVFYSVYPALQVVMCLSGGVNGKEKMKTALTEIVKMWRREDEGCHIGFSYGQIRQTGIPEVFAQAREAMTYAAFTGESQIVDYQQLSMSRRVPTNIQKYEHRFLEAIEHGQTENVKETAEAFIQECRSLHTEPRLIRHFVLEFIYNALSLKQKLLLEGQDYRSGMRINDEYECPPHLYVEQCGSYQELTEWFLGEMIRIAHCVADNQGDAQNRRQIQDVKDYIHTYYQKDITLFEVAEIAHMTPAYFSNVFRQEVGQTYIRYLTHVRVEKAKELLLLGHKVADVSRQVGYENYRYFCMIFKKYTGMTPQQFKTGNAG